MKRKEKLLIKFLLMSFVDLASLKSEMEVNRCRPKNKLKTKMKKNADLIL